MFVGRFVGAFVGLFVGTLVGEEVGVSGIRRKKSFWQPGMLQFLSECVCSHSQSCFLLTI